MNNILFSLAVTLAGLSLVASPQPPAKPTQVPAGHPAVSMPNEEPREGEFSADPADVVSIDAIVDAYYASISAGKGQQRNWDRFSSLFMSGARFIVMRPGSERAEPMTLSPDEYIQTNRTYFERGGYFENDIHREVDSFGKIAQVFSTFVSRRSKDATPYARGINSLQLVNDGQRWWIASVLWDHEKPVTNPIPGQYLPEQSGE